MVETNNDFPTTRIWGMGLIYDDPMRGVLSPVVAIPFSIEEIDIKYENKWLEIISLISALRDKLFVHGSSDVIEWDRKMIICSVISNCMLYLVVEAPPNYGEQWYASKISAILEQLSSGGLLDDLSKIDHLDFEKDESIINNLGMKITIPFIKLLFTELPLSIECRYAIAFHFVINILELHWIQLLDISSERFMDTISEIWKWNDSIDRFPEPLIKLLCTYIDEGRSTIGLDIEEMKQYPELVLRIAKVLRLRRREMYRLIISKTDDNYDLTPLWLTAYGHQILNLLGYGLTCSETQFEKIRTLIGDMGFSLQETCEPMDVYNPTMSPRLREYILNKPRQISKDEVHRILFK